MQNEVYYKKSSLLRSIVHEKKLFVTFRESTIWEVFKLLQYAAHATVPWYARFRLPREEPTLGTMW